MLYKAYEKGRTRYILIDAIDLSKIVIFIA